MDIVDLIKIAPILKSGIDDFYTETKEKLDKLKEILITKLHEKDFPYNKVTHDNKKYISDNLVLLKKLGINTQECEKIIKKINEKFKE